MKVKLVVSSIFLALILVVIIAFNLRQTEPVNLTEDLRNTILETYNSKDDAIGPYYKYINEDSLHIQDVFNNVDFIYLTFSVELPDTELRLIGDAVLNKGVVGGYKYNSGSLSTNLIKNRVVKIKDKYYLYIYGFNYDNEIYKIVAIDGKKRYEIDTLYKDFYTKEFLVDEEIKDTNVLSTIEYTIYNKKAEDITKNIKNKHKSLLK